MDKRTQDIAYFISFCIELYKANVHLTGTDAMQLLDKFGVLNYLEDNFEILHTQSPQWILEDIEEFIQLRKEKQNETLPR